MNCIGWITFFLGFWASAAFAGDYHYEKRLIDRHVVHIVTLPMGRYQARLVKANDGQGREIVPSIAKRNRAEIAINGGFFDIGGSVDGMPSRTLVVEGKRYKVLHRKQPLVVIDKGHVAIEDTNPSKKKVATCSMVSGIPLLVKKGKVVASLAKKKGGFYTKAHARTALGVKANGDVVIVVAENYYERDLGQVTLGDLHHLLDEKGDALAKEYHKASADELTLDEVRSMMRNTLTRADKSQGLTVVELATLMRDLGCQSAINLDGGGSSTLWIKGQVINEAFGDHDEREGERTVRPVSDAILFTKRH